MTTRKLNLEDFKENHLSRQQIATIIGGAPPLPLPGGDDYGNIPPATGGNNGGDSGDGPSGQPVDPTGKL